MNLFKTNSYICFFFCRINFVVTSFKLWILSVVCWRIHNIEDVNRKTLFLTSCFPFTSCGTTLHISRWKKKFTYQTCGSSSLCQDIRCCRPHSLLLKVCCIVISQTKTILFKMEKSVWFYKFAYLDFAYGIPNLIRTYIFQHFPVDADIISCLRAIHNVIERQLQFQAFFISDYWFCITFPILYDWIAYRRIPK